MQDRFALVTPTNIIRILFCLICWSCYGHVAEMHGGVRHSLVLVRSASVLSIRSLPCLPAVLCANYHLDFLEFKIIGQFFGTFICKLQFSWKGPEEVYTPKADTPCSRPVDRFVWFYENWFYFCCSENAAVQDTRKNILTVVLVSLRTGQEKDLTFVHQKDYLFGPCQTNKHLFGLLQRPKIAAVIVTASTLFQVGFCTKPSHQLARLQISQPKSTWSLAVEQRTYLSPFQKYQIVKMCSACYK